MRVWRDGARVRVEELDGSPRFVTDGTSTWTFTPGEPAFAARGRRTVFLGRGTRLLARREARDVLEGDLSRPTGPVRGAVHRARPAWEVEMAPREGAEHPVQVVVDAATGLVLEQRVDAVGAIDAWTDLSIGGTFDDALFTWTGPIGGRDALADSVVRLDARQEAERAAGAAWWSEHVAPLSRSATVEVGLDLSLSSVDQQDDGGFLAWLGEDMTASVARRPRSAAPWEHGLNHRWSTRRWDWAFSAHGVRLTDAGHAVVERCFGDGAEEG